MNEALSILDQTVLRTVAWQESNELNLLHAALGLQGEAGEFGDLVKKIAIYKSRELDDDKVIDSLAYELGDILWYVQLASAVIGIDMTLIIEMNAEKLKLRYPEKFSAEASEAKVDKQATGEIE